MLNKLGEGSLTWSDIDNIGINPGYYSHSYLSNHNREIAIAKVKVNTGKYSSDDNTIQKSIKRYKIESDVNRIAVLIGILSLVITIPFSLLILYIVTVLWYFILNRISELSKAVQGKR